MGAFSSGATPVIYSFVLFQGRLVAACYVKPKKGSTDSQHGLRQLEGSWIAMMARSRATARTDTAISKPCVFLPLLAESGVRDSDRYVHVCL